MQVLELPRPSFLICMAYDFADWLTEFRKHAGLTMQVLADMAETSHPHISDIEKRRRIASPELTERLASSIGEALQVDDVRTFVNEAKLARGLMAELEEDEIVRVINGRPRVVKEVDKTLRYITDPEDAEMFDAYEGLPEAIQESYRENILRVAREMRRETKSKDEIGTIRADEEENPTRPGPE